VGDHLLLPGAAWTPCVKRKLLIVACVLLAIVGVACWRLIAPFRVISQLDARYQQVQRGMSTNQVQTIMSTPGRWHTNTVYAGWDDPPLPEADVRRIRGAMRYSVSTFFLPVSFEFTFDETGKVVGRHRYD
jgi:hypothetical protein